MDDTIIKPRKSDKQKLLDVIKVKQRQSQVDKDQHDADKIRKELNEIKKHYNEFRKKVRNLDVEEIMQEEKSFCVFGAEDMDASKVESEILHRVK